MNKQQLSLKDDLHRAYNEIYALKNLVHQNICQLFEVFENDSYIYLVIEYCPHGELFDYIVSKKRLGEKEARHVFRQIIAAVAYIHKQGYAHRDLKPENMLLDNSKNIKIIDFGLSAKPEKGLATLLRTRAGSALYASPELISGQPYYGNETDVWSLGVVLFALLCGFLPFDHESTSELYKKIKKGDFPTPPWLSPRSLKILKVMLEVTPQKRINLKNIIKHEWMTFGYTEQIQWDSSKKSVALNSKVVRILAEYKCTTCEEMEAKITKFKYNHVTAFYFLLCKMSDDKLQKFVSNWCKQQVKVDEALLNNLLVSSNKSQLNGYIEDSPIVEKKRASTLSSNKPRPNSTLVKDGIDNPRQNSTSVHESIKVNPKTSRYSKPRASSVADIYNKDFLFAKSAGQKASLPRLFSRRKERSKTVTSCDKENDLPSKGVINPRIIKIKDEDSIVSPYKPNPNLNQTKRLANSCMDSLDSMKPPSTRVEDERERKSVSLEGGRKPRTKSMKEFKQKLSGFFKHNETPRRVKAIYHVENTSTLPPDTIKLELERVLNMLVLADVLNSFATPEHYLFKCKAGTDKKTVFELEICLIPYMDNVVGIRRKRLKGDGWKYKELVEQVLSMAKI